MTELALHFQNIRRVLSSKNPPCPLNLRSIYKQNMNILKSLTESQLLLWTGQQMHPNAPLYNMIFTFEISGKINVEAFQEAFAVLCVQCDAMRTIFTEENGVPQQQVLPSIKDELTYLDWSNDANKVAKLKQWLATHNTQIFDLSKRLFDSALLKISDEKYIWYLNQHHLITDGLAIAVQYRAMSELYRHVLDNTLENATPLPLYSSYIDYESQAKSASQRATNYWKSLSENLPPTPPIYGKKPSTNATPTGSQRISIDLGKERSAQLRILAQEPDIKGWTQHLSLFNILTTVLFAWLHRVSGQSQLAISTPVHNRPTSDFKNTPGAFIELFPLATNIENDDTFGALFQRLRLESLNFLKYAKTGMASPQLNRGINVVLNYILGTYGDFDGLPVQAEWRHPNHADAGHHLRLQVMDFDDSGDIRLYFDANTAVFSKEQRARISRHFLALLDAFIADRTQSIFKPSLISEEEEKEIIFDFNTMGNQMSDTFEVSDIKPLSTLQLFENQVENYSDNTIISYKKDNYTYSDFNTKTNQLAHFLQSKNIISGSRVAIYMKRSPDLLMSIFAVWKCGATYIPIATDYPSERVQYMLEDAQAGLLITHRNLSEKLRTQTPIVNLDNERENIRQKPITSLQVNSASPAYMMYTSGSTGRPKGVVISHESLSNYLQWAKAKYVTMPNPAIPLFTSVGFDLTVTSLFLPFISNGKSIIYEENETGADLSVLDVIKENQVDIIKLTPSHLALLKGKKYENSLIRTMIVGGEDFKTELAISIQNSFSSDLKIYNEYGPTEATVGCIVQQFDRENTPQNSVPIGVPIANVGAFVLDNFGNTVPQGVVGELYISGVGLAEKYWERVDLTNEKFTEKYATLAPRMYRTGDLARLNEAGQLEYLGRIDQQVKISGRRIELGEIEATLNAHPDLENCVVIFQKQAKSVTPETHNCTRCGLPDNYPTAEFDMEGVCNICRSFENYKERAKRYFKTPNELQILFEKGKERKTGKYDCLALLSGGKDSTYVLAQLVKMGLSVLAFTLDNGYISEQAKDNVRRVVKALSVDHIFGETPAMNEIFVDSLQRHCNVCNGCFKTIYTLSTQVALDEGIPFIVTGLSRGQFFETRLTEELFWKDDVDIEGIDNIVLNARKAYHQVDDAVKRLLDTSVFDKDETFEKVQFVDYYRYTDVSLDEMLRYLDERLPWVRPTDTGRSTNCLINQVGIYVHKKEQGYSNYAFPYSWDVRVEHKTRDASLEEINEKIDEPEVLRIMEEIGYENVTSKSRLVAYFTGKEKTTGELRNYLAKHLPEYMIPTHFLQMNELPLTSNGKVDRAALPTFTDASEINVKYIAPSNEFEEILHEIWSEVLNIQQIGVNDNFLILGGSSLSAIRIATRMEEAFELKISVNKVFEYSTIAELGEYIEGMILELLEGEEG